VTLKATVLPKYASQNVSWSSSDESIATVANGKVTTAGFGDVIISATSEDGYFTATCTIGVRDGVRINGVIWAKANVDAPGTFAELPTSEGMMYQWNRITAWNANTPTENPAGWNTTSPEGTEWNAENDPSPAGWRLPTHAEFQRLTDPTKVRSEWVWEHPGFKGRIFTDIATGESISLAAAGYRTVRDGGLDD
jgi:hypothetical protein